MNRCEFCNAPMLSMVTVCPNCHREQPPYPPVLPGGGGKSFSGWALILSLLGAGLFILGVVMLFTAPVSNVSAYIYGSPDSYINGNNPTYLGNSSGNPLYPGYGYLLLFGGIAVVLWAWAFISYSRGRRIDSANAAVLRSLEHHNNEISKTR